MVSPKTRTYNSCPERFSLLLGFEKPDITAFHKQNDELREKALEMLLQWRAKYGSWATFRVLYDALCDEYVGETEFAQKYCCYS